MKVWCGGDKVKFENCQNKLINLAAQRGLFTPSRCLTHLVPVAGALMGNWM